MEIFEERSCTSSIPNIVLIQYAFKMKKLKLFDQLADAVTDDLILLDNPAMLAYFLSKQSGFIDHMDHFLNIVRIAIESEKYLSFIVLVNYTIEYIPLLLD